MKVVIYLIKILNKGFKLFFYCVLYRKNEITTKLSETNDRFLMPKGN